MGKITYLCGAGASCQCLPIVNDLEPRFELFAKELTRLTYTNLPELETHDPEFDSKKMLLELKNNVERFLPQIQKHASVDTFAKKLYITQQWEDYHTLKVVLSLFFIYEQRNDRIDDR